MAVGALVAAAFVGYSTLSYYVQVPRVFGDELIYLDAADSIADGHGLHVQGGSYGRGPAYPASIAPLLRISQNRSDMYIWIKALNALSFALAAVPIYLLARRLLPRKHSLAVAALSVGIPSSVYIGLVMTESLAYLASSLALYAIVRAVENPTWRRQLWALASIVVAYAVRPQFVAYYPVYLLAQLVSLALAPAGTRGERRRGLKPTATSVVVAVAAVVAAVLASGQSALGSYGDLWHSYRVFAVARWFEYDLTGLGLYLGLVPLALTPPIVVALYRRARAGSADAAAYLGVLCLATFFVLVVAAAFDSTPAGQGQLHDRYVFYVVPLWLTTGAVWIHDGALRSRNSAVVGMLALLAAVAAFPADTRIVDDAAKQLHAAGTPLWVHVGHLATEHGQTVHRALFLSAIVAAAIAYLTPRRRAALLAVPVAAVFLANAAFLWTHDIRDNNTNVFAYQNSAKRGWIDSKVPAGQRATMLYVPSPHCSGKLPYAYLLTEFFNDRVNAAPNLDAPPPGGLPSKPVHVAPNGGIVDGSGTSLGAKWLVVPAGVKVEGTPVAEGTSQRLVLWRVDAPLRVHAGSDRQLSAQACRATE